MLEDCGLPGVDRFGSFLSEVLANQVAPETVPFLGCGRSELGTLWNPRGLSQSVGVGFGGLADYHGHLNLLVRLNPDDEIWRGAGQRSWFNTFGTALAGYMTELYSDRFVDRNGIGVSFDIAIDRGESDQARSQAGCPTARRCDRLDVRRIPRRRAVQSSLLFSRNSGCPTADYRGQRAATEQKAGELKKLTDAIESGVLAESRRSGSAGHSRAARRRLASCSTGSLARGKETPVDCFPRGPNGSS